MKEISIGAVKRIINEVQCTMTTQAEKDAIGKVLDALRQEFDPGYGANSINYFILNTAFDGSGLSLEDCNCSGLYTDHGFLVVAGSKIACSYLDLLPIVWKGKEQETDFSEMLRTGKAICEDFPNGDITSLIARANEKGDHFACDEKKTEYCLTMTEDIEFDSVQSATKFLLRCSGMEELWVNASGVDAKTVGELEHFEGYKPRTRKRTSA